jgi:hypothetical protein
MFGSFISRFPIQIRCLLYLSLFSKLVIHYHYSVSMLTLKATNQRQVLHNFSYNISITFFVIGLFFQEQIYTYMII